MMFCPCSYAWHPYFPYGLRCTIDSNVNIAGIRFVGQKKITPAVVAAEAVGVLLLPKKRHFPVQNTEG